MTHKSQKEKDEHAKGVSRAYNYVCRLLTRRDYTVFQIRTKLKQKSYDTEVAEETIGKFVELGFLDDAAYVGKYVRSRISIKPRSQYLLGLELRKKGISKDLIETYFSEEPMDELEVARKLIASKTRRIKNTEPSKRREKAAYILRSRGFNIEIQRKILSLLSTIL